MATIHYKTGERVLFQSSEYPELAPYSVTIHSVNYSAAGAAYPYYRYISDKGDVSQLYPYTCFTPLVVDGLTGDQIAEMARTRAYFPFRIIWADIVDGVFNVHASKDRRQMNKSARAGNKVYTLK